MADNFIFEVGGNIDGFKKTISQVEAELKRVRGNLKDQLGQGLVDANKNIAQLEQSIINLRNVGLDKLPKSAYAGTAALNSISQVARDLPFGFIAIQNNLPIVLDQFSQLSKTSGGLGGALKAVGASLIGPAGLSFAFGAIIAGVTTLVQKYGSLSAAFGEILGLTTEAQKIQKTYNKELIDASGSAAAENAKVNILVKTLRDSKKPYEDRIAAYQELKRTAPDVISGISQENALTQTSIELIGKQAEQRKNIILLKAQEQAVNKVIAEQTNKQLQLEIERASLIANFTQAQEAYNRAKAQGIIDAAQAEGFQAVEVITLNKATSALKENITAYNQTINVTDSYLKKLEPLISQLSAYTKNVDDNKTALEKQIEAQKEAARVAQLLSGFNAKATFAGIDFDNLVQKNAKNLSNWNAIIEKIAEKTFSAKIAFDGANNTLSRSENFQMDKIFGGLFAQDTLNQIIKTEEKTKNAFKNIDDQIRKQEQTYNKLQGTIQSALIAPLEYLSNTVLEKGKFSWQEFGKVVLKTLAGILTSIIATTIAASIANAIIPGAGTAGVAAYNQANSVFGTTGGKISPSLGYVPLGLKKEANLAGVTGGGMALSGSVVMVQRGSDLVGVLSRTNASINKVG